MFVNVLTTYDGRCYIVCCCAYHSGVASIHVIYFCDEATCILLLEKGEVNTPTPPGMVTLVIHVVCTINADV